MRNPTVYIPVKRYQASLDLGAANPIEGWTGVEVASLDTIPDSNQIFEGILNLINVKIRMVHGIRSIRGDELVDRTFKRYIRLVKGLVAKKYKEVGYSQGDEWEFYLIGRDDDDFGFLADELGCWLRSDVYYVKDRKTGEHYDRIFARTEREAIEWVMNYQQGF